MIWHEACACLKLAKVLQACVSKAKKVPKLSSETKAEIEAFEAKLDATAAEKREEQAVGQAAAVEVEDVNEPQDMQTGVWHQPNPLQLWLQHCVKCHKLSQPRGTM